MPLLLPAGDAYRSSERDHESADTIAEDTACELCQHMHALPICTVIVLTLVQNKAMPPYTLVRFNV